MKLSIYTFVKDGLYYDFHIAAMLEHHLPLADEIIVNEGFSSDGTFEAIRNIDPKIKVVRNRLDKSEAQAWHRRAKQQARVLCTGDWCILLDCDEFIPEWEFDRLREHLARTDKHIVSAVYKHFYGNYKVFYELPDRPFPPKQKWIIHRNLKDIAVFGDGSDVHSDSLGPDANDHTTTFECHHFGEVRHPARLRHKWRMQLKQNVQNRWNWLPGFLFDFRPHRWDDETFLRYLKTYDGPYIDAIRRDPREFVRDDFMLYERLTRDASTRRELGSI